MGEDRRVVLPGVHVARARRVGEPAFGVRGQEEEHEERGEEERSTSSDMMVWRQLNPL